MKLVIKNGHVMDPASGRDEVTDIWVEDKRIIGFGEFRGRREKSLCIFRKGFYT